MARTPFLKGLETALSCSWSIISSQSESIPFSVIQMSLVRAKFDEGPVVPTVREGRGLNELTVLLSSGLFSGNMLGGTFLIQVEIGS